MLFLTNRGKHPVPLLATPLGQQVKVRMLEKSKKFRWILKILLRSGLEQDND